MRKLPLTLAAVFLLAGCDTDESASRIPAAGGSAPVALSEAGSPGADSLLLRADSSRTLGDPEAPVWLIVVSDFECPYCRMWHDQTYPSIVSRYVEPGHLRLAYVHLPGNSHPHARATAEASMCAGLQGKFWEFHDAIFASFDEWRPLRRGTPFFVEQLPQRAGVHAAALRECVEAGTMASLVQADFDRSLAAGLNSTPSFVLDDTVLIRGAQPLAEFERAIDAALARRGIAAPPR